MVSAAPRLVVLGAHEGVRVVRAVRLAAHYGVPRLPATDLLNRRQPLPPGGYVLDSAPHLLDEASDTGSLRLALAFADLIVAVDAVLRGRAPDPPDGPRDGP